MPFLHDRDDFKELLNVTAQELGLLPSFVEKDYWIMHCLYGLQTQGFKFEMKGGTSLSKGFKIIRRFSEDIDIKIHPSSEQTVYIGKSHDKQKHIESRRIFFDKLANEIKILGLIGVERDKSFDDLKMRNAGIRFLYPTLFDYSGALKSGVLLEVGFAHTEPNLVLDFSSWAYDQAPAVWKEVIDNRAKAIKCYLPNYTFVEKLQAISHKFNQLQNIEKIPANFMRHYYDVYELLGTESVQKFLGTEEYLLLKKDRFRSLDDAVISKNEAFLLSDPELKKKLEDEYARIQGFFYEEPPSFDEILARIRENLERL